MQWTVLKRVKTPCATYEIGTYAKGEGLRWRRVVNGRTDQESQGAFYDADDHPEGAVAWATAAAQKHAMKTPCRVSRRKRKAR